MNITVPNSALTCCSAGNRRSAGLGPRALPSRRCAKCGDPHNTDSVHTSRRHIPGRKLGRWNHRVQTGPAMFHCPVSSHIQDSIEWVTLGFPTHFCMSRRIWTSQALFLQVWRRRRWGWTCRDSCSVSVGESVDRWFYGIYWDAGI